MIHFETGLYVHYKGGRYLALMLAETHHHNGDLDVVYISLTHGKGVTRPYTRDLRNEDAWTDLVVWPDGKMHPRFTHIGAFSDEWLIIRAAVP
jgi:hypothetical protein